MLTPAAGSSWAASLERLRPVDEATTADLKRALADVGAAAGAGQAMHAFERTLRVDAGPAALRRPIDALRESLAGPFLTRESAAAERTVVSIRSTPIADADPLAPAWTRGLRATRTFGPFVDEAGQRYWIDSFLLKPSVTLVGVGPSGVASMIARLPLSRGRPRGDTRSLRAGSAWFAAAELAAGRPADEFAGVRIRGGSVRIEGNVLEAGSTLTLTGDWSVTIQLNLEAPALVDIDSAIGADASEANVALPSKVTLTFSPTDAATIAFDAFDASAWGSESHFERSDAAPFVDAVTRSLVVPCGTTPPTFAFTRSDDVSFQLEGSTRIGRAGWSLPLTVTSADALGDADGIGAAWLEVSGALRAHWTGLARDTRPKLATLLLAPAALSVYATLLDGDARETLELWNDRRADTPRRCTLEVASVSGSIVLHISKPGSETVVFGGIAKPRIDRPVTSDGHGLGATFEAAWLAIATTDAATFAIVLGLEAAAMQAPHISFALENALLKTRPPVWLYAFGPLTGDRLDAGLLLLRFPLRALLPTLPDPYAANFEFPRTDVDTGWATAGIVWLDPAAPQLGFSLQSVAPMATPALPGNALALRGVAARGASACVLLDVSSNADQFGIAVPVNAQQQTRIEGLAVVVPAGIAPVITLPPISWEPMLTKMPASGTGGDPVLPPPPHDGGPAAVLAESLALEPATPDALLSAHVDAMLANRHFSARLPLPFGLIANLYTRTQGAGDAATFIPAGGSIYMNRPAFPGGLTGARQLGLRSAPRPSPEPPTFVDAVCPGKVEFVDTDDYAQAVLSTNLYTQFGEEFGYAGVNERIPLRHYELSGYGASIFSDWRNTAAPGPAIIQARFDVMVGRTAHEVIQMQSVIYPWFVRVTRSIIIDRVPGGWILREDTGWVAASDGLFAYGPGDAEAFTPAKRHPGAIDGVERVRNIQLSGVQFPLPVSGPDVIHWQPVLFDADVIFRTGATPRLAVVQGSASGRVPSRGIGGWIQIGGPQKNYVINGQTVPMTRPANAGEIFSLLSVAGPARAPLGCTLTLGGTDVEPGLTVKTSSVDVECNDDAFSPDLVAAVRGSPALPRDGAWSLARMASSETAPKSLDPSFPVPIVRPSAGDGTDRWHLADPADILKLADAATPAVRYGFVQALGAQKLFFGRVRAGNDAKPVSVPEAPKLADMGALLHAAGIFPGLADAFDLPNLRNLATTGGGDLDFDEAFDIAPGKEAVLVDLAGDNAIQIVIEYRNEKDVPTHVTLHVNPGGAPRWSVTLSRVCFAVKFKGDRLISIYATVLADEANAPTVKDLCVHYEGILDALQVIFSNVQEVARFLPGGVGAGLKVGFSQGRLTVHNAFALPNLPLGAGQITDVAVEMGFDVTLSPFGFRFVAGLGSSEKPFRWVVSPLAGTGCVEVGVGTEGLDVLVQGGLGLGLAIDLGIASGSAAIALAMEISTIENPFAVRGILSGRASVDVLQGLASATITLAAGLGFVPPPELFGPPFVPPQLLPPPDEIPELTLTLLASVSVGIHISICWVVDVDWDAYWQFRQQIKTPSIPIPV